MKRIPDNSSDEIKHAVLAERKRCADLARQYMEAIKDCSPNDDEPEKVYKAVMTGKPPVYLR